MTARRLLLALMTIVVHSTYAYGAECPPGTPKRPVGPQVCLEPLRSQVQQAPAAGFAPPSLQKAPKAGVVADVTNDSSVEGLEKLARRMKIGVSENLVVKVVYDVNAKSGRKVHFINTKKYQYHFSYASEVLGFNRGNEEFNRNYSGPLTEREYALASVILPTKVGAPALLELWSGDTMDAQGLLSLASDIQDSLPKSLKLKIHPLSVEQEQMVVKNFAPADYVLTKDLLGNITYLALNEGVAYGYVRFVNVSGPGISPLEIKDIAVFDQVPNEIGLVGGVVTAEPQTPLSHVNVKSMNRGTANMYLKDAKQALRAYEGKAVELRVEGSKYTIRELDSAKAEAQIAAFWKSKKPKLNGKPSFILDPRYDNELVRLDTYFKKRPTRKEHSRLVQIVGAKAANLGVLSQVISRVKSETLISPDTVGIPFNFYEQFINLKQKGLDSANPERVMTPQERIVEILNKGDLLNPDKIHSISVVRPTLEEVRAVVSRAQLPQRLVDLLRHAIMEDTTSPLYISKHPRLRFRSSTNSEDLEGFTGAGLYDSLGINLYKKKKGFDRNEPKKWEKIEEDLRKDIPSLYAGVWNERAFLEREWYSMNGSQHLDIKVGLAVHGAFPRLDFDGKEGEVANGVAITANIYNFEEDGKIYINAQHYDLAVTNPPTKEELVEVGEDPTKSYVTEETLVTTFLANPDDNAKAGAWKKWPFERVRSSSVKNGETVLKAAGEISGQSSDAGKRDELRELARALHYVHGELAKIYQKDFYDFAIDVEWKIYGPSRTIIIKQARPFR